MHTGNLVLGSAGLLLNAGLRMTVMPGLGLPATVPEPQMLLDFARGKYYAAEGPSGRLWERSLSAIQTFTRSGAATEYDASGALVSFAADTPRIAHDPATGRRLGLRVEGSVTNLLEQSDRSDLSPWTRVGATVTPSQLVSALRPDGWGWLRETAAAGEHYDEEVASVVGGTVYSYSRDYLPDGSGRLVHHHTTGAGAFGGLVFNPSTGAILSGSGVVQPLMGGGYRATVTGVAAATGSVAVRGQLRQDTGGAGTASYTGNGAAGVHVGRAQLEVGPPTSYIHTTTGAVTRAADRPTISLGPWWNAAGGTMWAQIKQMPADGITRRLMGVSAASATDGSIAVVKFTNNSLFFTGGGVSLTLLAAGGYTGQGLSIAFAWAAPNGAIRASLNGGSVVPDAATTILADQTQMRAGAAPWGTGGNEIDGIVTRVGYHATPLTDAQLQAISGMT